MSGIMDDTDFLDRLRQLTGQPEIWDSFSVEHAENSKEYDVDEDSAENSYDSDASQNLILNIRHVKPPSTDMAARSYKLNKARKMAADAPEHPRTVEALQKIKWKETGLIQGDMSAPAQTFVPWRLVREYPNMFVGKANSQRAAPFFNTLAALHDKGRVWDLFYAHYPPDSDKRHVIFVPTYQFQHLLDVINAILDTNLTIPPGANEKRFKMVFGAGNGPRPQFLGRTTTADSWNSLVDATPEPDGGFNWENVTPAGKDEFLELLALAHRGSSKEKSSEKSRQKRVVNHRAWGRSTKRVQRYLGLRQKTAAADSEPKTAPSLDLNSLPPHEPEGSVLFVSVDIEAYEFNQDVMTEIGIATLDAGEVANVAPGGNSPLGSKGWYPLIHTRHLRVKENAWAVNRKHVHGCPDRFNFGKSEFIAMHKVVPAVEAIVQQTVGGNKRPIVLVFHDTAADVKFLQNEGYDILKEPNVVDVIDTKEMHQYLNRSQNPRSLETVLGSAGISYRNLHNAGNDAAYTMRAMISLAIQQRQASLANVGKQKEKKPENGHVPFGEFVKTAEADEGWVSGGEGSDGGDPPRRQTVWA